MERDRPARDVVALLGHFDTRNALMSRMRAPSAFELTRPRTLERRTADHRRLWMQLLEVLHDGERLREAAAVIEFEDRNRSICSFVIKNAHHRPDALLEPELL